MFSHISSHRTAAVVLAVVLVAGAGGLTGCRSGVQVMRIHYERSLTPAESFGGLPADRIEQAIARDAARAAALSERFAGVPADRVQDQLDRETAG
jgi:hypothetical protein